MNRVSVAAAAVAGAALLTACSSSGGAAVAASAPPSGSPSPSAAASTQSAATAALTTSQCGGSDNGLASEFTAWSTLMRTGDGFVSWESATTSYLDLARGAANVDAGFSGADAADALAAQALAAALAQLNADLQQGVSTGQAPTSYPADAQAVKGAAALFAAC